MKQQAIEKCMVICLNGYNSIVSSIHLNFNIMHICVLHADGSGKFESTNTFFHSQNNTCIHAYKYRMEFKKFVRFFILQILTTLMMLK